MDHASDFGLMVCVACQTPVVLTVEQGFCPRCYYRLECEAICAAAEDEVDRVFEEAGLEGEAIASGDPVDWDAPAIPVPPGSLTIEPAAEPVWSW